MVSGTKLANALRGKTARACDSCLRNRAWWYCPADDAFQCQSLVMFPFTRRTHWLVDTKGFISKHRTWSPQTNRLCRIQFLPGTEGSPEGLELRGRKNT
ncbi:hypothetical protein U1Q18_014997 [Sarracenia purpurea var. burkii]